jgi:hypothetical protein
VELGGNRLGKFSFNMRRGFVGCALVPCIVTVADYSLGWGLFGRFGRLAIAASFVLLFLVVCYLGPTVQGIRDYRAKSR